MNRDDVIRMAREAGDDVEHTLPSDLDFLERFAALVAAAERERLAMAAESRTDGWCSLTAEEIRERGESDAP